jgi:HEXXH motif-containing protein
LLIGPVIDGAFFDLFDGLKASTVEHASRRWHRIIPAYSPWLCFAPLLDEVPAELIYLQPPVRGGLIADPLILSTMADFLAGPGRPAIDELPGETAAWLPGPSGAGHAFDGALAIIARTAGTVSDLYSRTVDYVVPLGGGRNRGFSTHLARGAIFRSLPAESDAWDVAIDLIHEVGHQVLMTWQSVDPILSSPHDAPVFSEIRRADRPAIQSFHAAVALAFMRFLELRHPDEPGMRAAAARRGASYSGSLSLSLELALKVVREACAVTDLGRRMIGEMEAVV